MIIEPRIANPPDWEAFGGKLHEGHMFTAVTNDYLQRFQKLPHICNIPITFLSFNAEIRKFR